VFQNKHPGLLSCITLSSLDTLPRNGRPQTARQMQLNCVQEGDTALRATVAVLALYKRQENAASDNVKES